MKNLLVKGMVLSLVLAVALTALVPFESYAASQATTKKININTATLIELQELPRIGEKIAQRIIDFRKENGNFKSTADLLKVKGIGEKVFESLKDRITV
ncbi:MAG: ComEA family DNA-binding protein [Candidatus Aminicenantes bacterium]|nr:ComEA family DNA-binding protein [Candidatus Aminicenantes bacterium]